MSTNPSTRTTLPLYKIGRPGAPKAASPKPSHFRISAEMAALRNGKTRLSYLSEYEQRVFENGGSVEEMPLAPGGYLFIRLESGAMTINGLPCDKAKFDLYQRWRKDEGLRGLSKFETYKHMKSVERRLRSLGVRFGSCYGAGEIEKASGLVRYGEAWKIIDEVLSVLPDKMLENGDLWAVEFGSQRVGPGKLGSYENHTAYIYSGAMKGSRRELIAKLLHELGHSTLASLDPATVSQLEGWHEKMMGSFIGLDIMGGPEYREGYQHSFEEFLAEMHTIYVCAGPLLREKIRSLPINSEQRQAWENIYAFCRDQVFDGREYE